MAVLHLAIDLLYNHLTWLTKIISPWLKYWRYHSLAKSCLFTLPLLTCVGTPAGMWPPAQRWSPTTPACRTADLHTSPNTENTHTKDSNSLWPSHTIWWHRSGSTLVQVFACCLMAASHYLNQCWLFVTEILWHPSEGTYRRCSGYLSLKWVCKWLI